MDMTPILTEAQRKRSLRDAKLYKEYLVLTAVPESSRTAIMQILMKKYEIASTSTYYDIINRMKGGTNEMVFSHLHLRHHWGRLHPARY